MATNKADDRMATFVGSSPPQFPTGEPEEVPQATHLAPAGTDSKRQNKFTEKGMDYFRDMCCKYSYKLTKLGAELEGLVQSRHISTCSVKELRQIDVKVSDIFTRYQDLSAEFMNFLGRHNTEESVVEQSSHSFIRRSYAEKVHAFKCLLSCKGSEDCHSNSDISVKSTKGNQGCQSKSSNTVKSHSSKRSSIGGSSISTILDKQMRAEAAKAKLKFVKRENELKRSAATIQADMEELQAYKEMAVAEAELSVIQQENQSVRSTSSQRVDTNLILKRYFDEADKTQPIASVKLNVNAPTFDPPQHSSPYTAQQCSDGGQYETINVRGAEHLSQDFHSPFEQQCNEQSPHVTPYIPNMQTLPVRGPIDKQSPHVTPYIPNMQTLPDRGPIDNSGIDPMKSQNVLSDFARLWLKKDLVTKIEQFDDRPEHYAAWKASFKRVVLELVLTPSEELELLVKWLGPVSGNDARSIRSSHAHDPTMGCHAVWLRLEERYGAPEMVEASIKRKLEQIQKISNGDADTLFELSNILSEIVALKANPDYQNLLAYYDSSSGVSPIVAKLPHGIQDKWTTRAFQYKQKNGVPYPPFTYFVSFMREMSSMRNDPSFVYEQSHSKVTKQQRDVTHRDRNTVSTKKTDVTAQVSNSGPTHGLDVVNKCPIHNTNHSLNDCEKFRKMSLEKRRVFLRTNGICYKCCASTEHQMSDCSTWTPCALCTSTLHPTAMHLYKKERPQSNSAETISVHGGENSVISSMCTQLCGSTSGGRSCSKIVLVKVFPNGSPQDAVTVYAVVDDQSSHTLARSDLLDKLCVSSPAVPYKLSSCAGVMETTGRRAAGFSVQSIDGSNGHKLPPIIECNDIPDSVHEIPTPEVAHAHPHLNVIADKLPPLAQDAGIQLLIGRDLVEAHQVRDQIIGPPGAPFAQQLSLGWVIIGDVCLGGRHRPTNVNVCKTNILNNGRGTIFEPCENNFKVKFPVPVNDFDSLGSSFKGDSVFQTTRNDNKVGTSVEDREFLSLMDKEFKKNEDGNWTAPLPFKNSQPCLPNNRVQALKRSKSLDASLKKNPVKLRHMVEFMEKIFRSGAAEIAPPLSNDDQCWYLPIFGVYHPRKPGKVRGVFDSSVVYGGKSLNDSLLSGPNLTNSLLGILLRFRRDQYAIAGDIQQMFYRFFVNSNHRDYLRFYWYDNNTPESAMVEYRMKVHVFGNRPSPSVATYGLRRAVQNADTDVIEFVNRDFYVDDAITSRPTPAQAVDLMKRTQIALKEEGDIRLCKIVSNEPCIMEAFPADDRGKEIKELSLDDDSMLVQHSLGLSWNLSSDSFIFTVPETEVPFTRRGILSKVNSIFDPMGFLSPITICGKILLREMCSAGAQWDDPLPEEYHYSWCRWMRCLEGLITLRIPRMFAPISLSLAGNPEVLIFSDASEKAIAAAAYLKLGDQHMGFIMGKSKLAPVSGHSIPRLELCGAVLATEIGEFIVEHLDVSPSSIRYLTDSKVVLGYIRNRTRRFYIYVSNRVTRIHSVSSPEQWSYVPTHLNPADRATRGSLPDVLDSLDVWLKGPIHLVQFTEPLVNGIAGDLPLVNPDEDPEVRPDIVTLKSDIDVTFSPLVERFSKFSTWERLVIALSVLRHIAESYSELIRCTGWHQCDETKSVSFRTETEQFILQQIQYQAFPKEHIALATKTGLPRDSPILMLSPYVDEKGLLRVGGRLNKLKDTVGLASLNPLIIPKGHVAALLASFFHSKVSHQGRGITEGAIRSNGFWIIGAKKLISSMINKCITCRRLRRKPQTQKMADLPIDRLTPGPPFTSVGVDVFGPWQVVTRRTRGGSAQSKRWAALFTCLTTRAVHIELLEDMSSSCFINALRRFVALRGPVKLLRSDRGTNFIGAVDEIKAHVVNVEDKGISSYMKESDMSWMFNAPHASHMGGVWERAIGLARKILDSMLLKEGTKEITHEVLATLMLEVCAIMNSRPIAVVDSDPDDPMVLTPNILLTHKQGDVARLSENLGLKDMYAAQWKHVQVLSDMFWKKWREGYLKTLQVRQKWCESQVNLKPGDVVLLRDKNCHRNNWPIAIIEQSIESEDQLVRKATVRVAQNGKTVIYTRPISEMVLLLDQ